MTRALSTGVGLAVAIGVLAPGAARADEGAATRAIFAEGEQAYARGEVEVALGYFRRAYELAPHDAVRFNIAVCLESLGRPAEALAEYEAAAASGTLGPEDRERARLEAQRVRAQIGEPPAVDPAPAITPPPAPAPVARVAPPPPRRGPGSARGRAGWLTWGGAGLGLAGLAAGVIFGLETVALDDEYQDAPTVARRDDGLFYRDLANAPFVIAGVGLVLVALDLWLGLSGARDGGAAP